MKFREYLNEKLKLGNKYNDWYISKFIPKTYDNLGSINGGYIELTNNNTKEILVIQNDKMLRGDKWNSLNIKGVSISDKNPEVLIKKCIEAYKKYGLKKLIGA